MTSGSERAASSATTTPGAPAREIWHSSGPAANPNPTITTRSASSPFPPSSSPSSSQSMGQTFARPNVAPPPSLPPSSPSTAARGLTAAMAGGIKLKRAFAGRRKKSEDVGKLMTNARDDSGSVQEQPSPFHHHGVEATPSSSSSPAQVMTYSAAASSSSHDAGPAAARGTKHLSQLATHVFNAKRSSKSPLQVPPMPIQQPPVPPPKPTPSPTAPNMSTPPRPAPLALRADYRSSIIPISPGISSAVDFMRMSEEQQRGIDEMRKDREVAAEGAAKPSESGDIAKSDIPDKEKEKAEMKDSWRKSDSTIGHGTIRAGSSRPSRPVSMAESLQSIHTIVPVNKRLSALITDADFGMPEEDDSDRSFQEINISTATPANNSLIGHTTFSTPAASPHQASPTSSIKTKNRRSMSLNITTYAAFSKNKALPATASGSSATPEDLKHSMSEQSHMPSAMSPSMSREAPPSLRTPMNATGFIAPSSSGVQSTGTNIRGRLAALAATTAQNQPPTSSPGSTLAHSQQHTSNPHSYTNNPYTTFPPPPSSAPTPISRLDRSLPALPPPPSSYPQPTLAPGSFRQTAISMTSGFAPAAGLAKRAVEKMGRAWGISSSSSNSNNSGYASSSSSRAGTDNNTPPSSYSSGGGFVSHGHGHGHRRHPSQELTRTASNQSASAALGGQPQHLRKKNRLRHTPNAPSVSSSITTASTASMSDSGGAPAGPVLGKRLRGPLRGKVGSGGVVFGRDLRTVVRETKVGVGKPRVWGGKWRNWDGEEEEWEDGDEYGGSERDRNRDGSGERGRERRGSVRRGQLKALEERKLPALVVRCAQHLLIWGVQEEGLFRVSGRPSHVSKLRAEFDSGADFDMTESSPGDLDPHAVASVFKAFLRELPEPILTHALLPYFDAAMTQETTKNAAADASQPQREGNARSNGPGLPTGPRNSGTLPALRKPPSLSTLAMPAFTGMRPPSQALLHTFQALLAQLPDENRDLIRTVTELINATARESKETKMPLSNLLLVFCPSLNMNPPLLRVLCEAEGIWEDVVMEIKRRDGGDEQSSSSSSSEADEVIDTRAEGEDEFEDARDGTEEDGESESVGRTSEDVPSSVEYHASTEDVASRVGHAERGPISTVYLDAEGSCADDSSSISQPHSRAAHLRGGSIAASSLRDDGSSFLSTSEDHDGPSRHSSDVQSQSVSPPLLTSSAESLDTPATSSGHPSYSHLPIDQSSLHEDKTHPQPGSTIPIIAESSPMGLSAPIPRKPVISNPIPIISPIEFPSSSVSDTAHNVDAQTKPEKRHSITLLSLPNFAPGQLLGGRDSAASQDTSSTSSLRGLRMKKPSLHLLFSKKSTSSLSSPRAASSPSSLRRPIISSPYMARSASDSSVSTPLSAVTAPQSSTFTLPPKLDTLIDSSSLRVGLGLGIDVIETPATPEKKEHENVSRSLQSSPANPMALLASASVTSLVAGSTPIADRFRSSSPSPSLLFASKSLTSLALPLESQQDVLPASHLRPNPTVRSRLTSTSSNHLGMLDDRDPAEDWTRSVLIAADLEGGRIAERSARV
ncbi:hypothetical protein Hypma_002426 [Hypsizygus marmoreus]|uniref:Rho-GAP domain-containing protein n=1 Tax=Hypsizygus marmoreus TaxID=39966 RepID=A0A369JBU4_HYPMA|nr:hypothetical protein Hypma_002426 [Hypsizygus marmoreus]